MTDSWTGGPVGRPGSRLMSTLRELLIRTLPFALLILIWGGLVTAFQVPSRLMPGPLQVAHRIFVGLVTQGDLWPHLWLTLQSTVMGYVAGSLAAIAFGSLLAMDRRAELVFYPLALLIQAVPKVAIAPLILLWLGYQTRSTVTLVALICFFPAFVSTFIGIRSTPAVLLDLFHTLNASAFKTYLHCCIRHATGAILAGLQVGWGFALVGCVVVEFIMGTGGAGFLIDNSANQLDTVTAVAAMVLLGVMGYLGGGLLVIARRRMVFWEGER